MHASGIGQTDIGRKRESNEDRLLIDNDLGLYVVSDGMGGHAGGEAAAETAVAAVERVVRDDRSKIHRVRSGRLPAEDLEKLLIKAVRGACREVYRLAVSKPELAGMGCTLTALLVAGSKAAMAHVGDTRLYLWRRDGLHQLSIDHTMVEDLVRLGSIQRSEANTHPFANALTRAIGSQESVHADTLCFEVLPGDRYLLCSDGLSRYVEDPMDLARRVGRSDLESIPDELIEYANQAGGRDNVTAVIVEIEFDPEAHPLALALSEVEVQLDVLSSVFLFEDLTLAQLSRVLNSSRVETLQDQQTVVEENEPCSQLTLVLEGQFDLERDGQVVGQLTSGDYVGETTLLRRRPSRASIRAQGEGRVLVLGADAFLQLARSRPWLGVALFERLGRRLSLSADQRQEFTENDSETKEPEYGVF